MSEMPLADFDEKALKRMRQKPKQLMTLPRVYNVNRSTQIRTSRKEKSPSDRKWKMMRIAKTRPAQMRKFMRFAFR